MKGIGLRGFGMTPLISSGCAQSLQGILRDLFSDTRATGEVDGTLSIPGNGLRSVVDVEGNIITTRNSIRGFCQPTSAVWGESMCHWTANDGSGFPRIVGRTLVGLYTSMDMLACQMFGWDTAVDTADARTVGHGWANVNYGTVYSNLQAIEPGTTVAISVNGRQIHSSQYLIVIALNDTGAYTLISTFGTDIGDGYSLPNGDIIGIPQYPLARVLWASRVGTTTPLYPYVSGYNSMGDMYDQGHVWEDVRIVDVPTWTTPDYLSAFADRCTRADNNTTIGTGWTTNAGKVFGISNNQIYCVSGIGAEMAWHDSELSGDGIWQWDIFVPADWDAALHNYAFGAVIRLVDSSNYIFVWNNHANQLLASVFKAGVYDSNIFTLACVYAPGETTRITVVTHGNGYLAFANGVKITLRWYLDAGNNFLDAANFGIYAQNANGKDTRWDNFIATPNTITLPDSICDGAVPSVWTPGIIIASDAFVDADDTRLNNHAPDLGSAWDEKVGTWTIQSNEAAITPAESSGINLVVMDVGVSDYEMSVDVICANPFPDRMFGGIAFRYTDNTHYACFYPAAWEGNSEIEMWTKTSVYQSMTSKTTLVNPTFIPDVPITLTIRVKGMLAEVFLAGQPVGCRILPEELATGTKCGLVTDEHDGGTTYTNWVVKAL